MALGDRACPVLCLSVFSAWLSISNPPPQEGGGDLGEARMDLKSLVVPKEDGCLHFNDSVETPAFTSGEVGWDWNFT